MKTGIIKRIDDLGRIVIPKEIRRKFNIHEGDPLEISLDRNKVCFELYITSNDAVRKMPDKKPTEPIGNHNRLTDKEIMKALECCKAEIDGLRADLKRVCAEIDNAQICKYSYIESASILDFAERLRRQAVGLKLVNRDYRFVSVKEIDSLVIKMSGESNDR